MTAKTTAEKWVQAGLVLIVIGIFAKVFLGQHLAPRETLTPWPFSVDPVTLSCRAGRVFATGPDGVRYTVNGSARGEEPEMLPIQGYYNTQAAIDRGLKLCADGEQSVRVTAPAPAPYATPPAGASSVEPAEIFGGLSLSTTSAAPIDGKRPEISATCHEDGDAYIYLGLVRPPARPTEPRGIFMSLRFDDGPPTRFEVHWMPEAGWSPRDMPEADEKRLAIRLARARKVTVEGAQPHAPTPITWTIDLPDAERKQFVQQCLAPNSKETIMGGKSA